MSMALTPLAVIMETATCSWRESTCTTTRLLVSIWCHLALLAGAQEVTEKLLAYSLHRQTASKYT